jgi:hypothetical protein
MIANRQSKSDILMSRLLFKCIESTERRMTDKAAVALYGGGTEGIPFTAHAKCSRWVCAQPRNFSQLRSRVLKGVFTKLLFGALQHMWDIFEIFRLIALSAAIV